MEAYDLSTAPAPSKLANISSRGFVGIENNVLIGGVIVRGIAQQPIVFRAIGPDLDIAGALADPALDVYDENGNVFASNDDWRTTQEAELIASGLAPKNDPDAALLITLSLGNYTVIVHGAAGGSGIALVEAYALE